MFNNCKEFEQSVYDYLSDLINGSELFPPYYEEFQKDVLIIIETCVKENYISQVEVWHDADGCIHVNSFGNHYVTLKGYQFMKQFEENDVIKIAKRSEKRAKFSTLVSVIAMLISLSALFVQFASNYEKIKEFINLF